MREKIVSSAMINSESEYRNRWLKRLQSVRNQYAYQKWLNRSKEEKLSPKKVLKWIWNDIAFLIRWNINLLLQLKHFGRDVKKYSGLSFFEQWRRMAYLVFIIRTDSKKFRYNHLFEQERWEKADLFSYSIHIRAKLCITGFFPPEDVRQINHKLKFFESCKKHGWNTPEIHAVYDQGSMIYPQEGQFQLPKKDLFIKNCNGGQGGDAKFLNFENGNYHNVEGQIFSPNDLHSYLRDESKTTESLLIQNAVKNHDEWKRFSNGSLATCRIVTGRSLKNKNEIIPFFATLKMPVGKSEADNFSLGGIASSVDLETGVLGKAVSSKPYRESFSWDVHPDTGENITGAVLYKWHELLEFSKEIHRSFSTLSVGWDVTLTENGLCVIEGNPFWGAEVIESPANKPLYMTSYPLWVEECIESFSGESLEANRAQFEY